MSRQQGRHRVVDVGLAVVVATLGLIEVWLPMDSIQGDGSRVVSTVGIVAVGALLTQRRSRPWSSVIGLAVWPVLGLISGGHLQILFFGQLVPVLVLVYTLARHGPGRLKWIGAIAGAAVLIIADVFLDVLRDPGELIFHWGVVSIAYLAGRGLRAAEDRATAAAIRAVEAEAAARERARTAAADERARIARELHDIVAHSVSVIVVQAGAAEQVVEEDPEFAHRALGAIRASGTAALAEMRRLVTMLRTADDTGSGTTDLAPQPGVDALPALVGTTREAGLSVDLAVTPPPARRPRLPASLDLTAYRIVQEALTNVRRHSTADRAQVTLHIGDRALRIVVHDTGPAVDGIGEPGHGLIGMRERVALFGGRLTAAPDGAGFTVTAELPLEPA